MADLSYSIGIDAAQAQRTLDALKSSIVGVGSAIAGIASAQQLVGIASRFEDLRVTLGVLYKDASQGAQAFDQIKKFAGESVFSVENLTESWIKLKSSGLEPTQRQLELFADVSSVAADSLGALRAITDLYARTTAGGLGLEDLNRLADRGIPVFNILAETMGIGRLEIEKYGRTAEGAKAILATLERELERQFGGASQARMNTLGQSINQVGDAFQNLIDRISQAGPGQGLSQSLQDIAKFLNQISVEQINTLVENIKSLAIAFVGLYAVGKVTDLVYGLSKSMTTAAVSGQSLLSTIAQKPGAMGNAAGGIQALQNAYYSLGTVIANLGKQGSLLVFIRSIALGIGRLLPIIGNLIAGFFAIDSVVTLLTGKDLGGWWNTLTVNMDRWLTATFPAVSSALEKLREFFGMGPGAARRQDMADEQAAQDQRLKNMDALRASESRLAEQQKKTSQQGILDLSLYRKEQEKSITAYRATMQAQLSQYDAQTKLMRLTEEQRVVVDALAEADRGYLESIKPLMDEYAKLKDSSAAVDIAKSKEIVGILQRISAEYENHKNQIRDSANERVRDLITLKEIAYQTDLITKAGERRASVDEAINELLLRGPQLAKAATDDYINSTLTPLQQQLNRIRKEELDLAQATKMRIAAQFSGPDGEILDAEGFAQAMAQIDRATQNNIRIRQDQARTEISYQQTFTAGWNKAFREYAQSAADASKRGAALFNRTVQGMEDLFVNFAKTGKFQWKNFLNDLGEALLRSQLQQLFAGIFGDMTTAMDSGKGFMGVLGQLLGFGSTARGSSAQNPMYVIDLASVKGGVGVGAEQGGGFFDTLLGGIKNIGSSIWDGVKNIGSSILGAIGLGGGGSGGGFFSSIVKGIGSLFGGFFATGGTLGAGRWGIAGERGPELITGPATVTPMMGQTYVTYNIQAMDALSFKQMVARDPSFIHAVAQQGSKGITRRY